jgi:hypothetical protein
MALWTRVAIRRCGQSKAWHAVAGMWTRMGRGAKGAYLCAPLIFLPPPRGETDAQNSHPMPCDDALPGAFGAVA